MIPDEKRPLEPTKERMIHAERMAALGEMAAGLAHEINNPLDGMIECLRYLEADPHKSERAEKYYPMLAEGLARISRVMGEMLDFARSGVRVRTEACRVAEMLESLVYLVRPRLAERKVSLSWTRSVGCVCLCDQQILMQAALNLVLNATDAAAGTPKHRVWIRASCVESEVHIAIEDSGTGVPDALREKIFVPFFSTKPRGQGTGLGLSVSRQMIRALGGDIALDENPSELGGARFVIHLPRVPDPGGDDEKL